MLGLGWQEVILILVILLLVFGPTKLPKIARELGKAVQELNKATSGFREEFDKASSDFTKAVRPSSTRFPGSSPRATGKRNRDKALSDIAGRLNITTEGKTEQQITQEIIEEIESKKEKASDIKDVKR